MTPINFVVPYRIPSLNSLFDMNHWDRKRERHKAQVAVLYALRATANACLTGKTSSGDASTWLMHCDMLESYLMTDRSKSSSKSGKSKSKPRMRNGPR